MTAAFRKVAPSSSVVAAANPTSSSSTGGKPTTLTIKGFSSDVNSDGTTPSVKIMVNPSQLKVNKKKLFLCWGTNSKSHSSLFLSPPLSLNLQHQIKVYNEIVDMDDDGNETADDEDDKDFKLNKRKSGGRGSASPRKQRGPTASSQLKAVTTTTTVSSIAREVSTRASAAAAAAIHVASSSLSKLADVASLVVGGSGDGGTVMNPSIVDGLGGGGSMDMMDLDTMVSAGHLPVGEGKEVEEVQDEMQMMSSASSASMECLPALSTLDALPPPPPSFRNGKEICKGKGVEKNGGGEICISNLSFKSSRLDSCRGNQPSSSSRKYNQYHNHQQVHQ